MYGSHLWFACLILVSFNAMAASRALLADESLIEFNVKEMGVPVPGKFKRFEAAIDIDATKPEKSIANVRIDIGSLTTGNAEADAIAVDADWLDEMHARYAVFKSSAIRALSAGRFEARGTLSIRNKERDVVIEFNSADHADGKTFITSEFTIARSVFGVGGGAWNQGDVVAEVIPVKVRFVLAPAVARASAAAAR